jgi:spermidine synthase
LNFLVCLVLLAPFWKTGSFQRIVLAVLSVLIALSGYVVFAGQADKLHHYSIRAQWKNQNIVHYQNSQYGNICVLDNQGQYIFFQDGIPSVITPIPDKPFIEDFVHLPLLAHPEPKRLLILSGGAGGVINAALKHPSIETIEYAELDPLLLDLFRKFPTPLTESELNDNRVQIRQTDGRLFIKTTRNTYDVILVGITEPSNLQSNRFFTKEFFSLAKTRLNEGGIIVLGLPGSLTYLSEELKNLNSCLFHTLTSVFPFVRVIPGDGTNLFLLSESQSPSTIDWKQILERSNQRNIRTDEIVPWHIEKKLHHGWQDWFSDFVTGGSRRINSDFKPVGLFYSISYWNSLFAPSLRWLFRQFEKIDLRTIVLLFAVFILLYTLLRLRGIRFFGAGIPFSIVTSGFAGMTFDLILIFVFQSIFGYVFSWIGLLVAFFMAGAACSAMLMTMNLARIKNCFRLFAGIELAIVGFSIGCPLVFLAVHEYLGSSGIFLLKLLFLAVSFVCGFLIGSQFPLANKIHLEDGTSLSKTAGLLYASDLLGGWLGGIIGAVVLLPVLGLIGTCITVGLLKLTSFIVLTTQHGRHL